MPQVFKIGSYTVYFWMNEGKPLEPVHVHVAQGFPPLVKFDIIVDHVIHAGQQKLSSGMDFMIITGWIIIADRFSNGRR